MVALSNGVKFHRFAQSHTPVPELEATTTPLDLVTPTTKPRRSTRKLKSKDDVPSDTDDDLSLGTPQRMTRSRIRSLSTTSVESLTSDVEGKEGDSVVTRKRTRSRGLSICSDGEASSTATPLRRSRRKSGLDDASNSESVSTPLRRSTRKKR